MYKGKKGQNILKRKKGQMNKHTIEGQKQETKDEKENYLCFH
jgi:hypothetical protein